MKTGSPLLKGHWLVVDDAELLRLNAVRLLQRLGATTETAENGAQALTALRERHKLAAVLTDGEMPQMDGHTTAAAIRHEEATQGLPRLPIILMTSDSNSESRAREAGMDAFIEKPLSSENLQAAIARIG